MSTDPALGEYIPGAPVNDEAKKRNENLPGMGGVYNTVNLHLYHYAGNNPVKYTDPDGRQGMPGIGNEFDYYTRKLLADRAAAKCTSSLADRILNGSIDGLPVEGPCLMAALQGNAETFTGKNLTAKQKLDSIKSLVPNSMREDFSVVNSPAVIKDALERLGVDTSNLLISVAKPGDDDYEKVKKNATGSIVSSYFLSGEGTHYQEGDSKGKFRWDPISGTSNGGRKPKGDEYTRYVWIREKEKTNE